MQKLFPGRKWDQPIGPMSGPCTLPDGSTGESWAITVTTREQGTLRQDIRTVVNAWKTKHLHIRTFDTSGPSDPIREIIAYPNDVEAVQFSHTDVADAIDVDSTCADLDPKAQDER